MPMTLTEILSAVAAAGVVVVVVSDAAADVSSLSLIESNVQ